MALWRISTGRRHHLLYYSGFTTKSQIFEKKTVKLRIGNVAKGAIFEKLRFSIIILRMKKLPKQDEFGILG
jgi:hypothetical protein